MGLGGWGKGGGRRDVVDGWGEWVGGCGGSGETHSYTMVVEGNRIRSDEIRAEL